MTKASQILHDQQLQQQLLLIRFRTTNVTRHSKTYFPIAKIALAFKMSKSLLQKFYNQKITNSLITLVNSNVENKRESNKQHYQYRQLLGRSSFTPEHYQFLTCQHTLIKQVGKSLYERCVLFHRRFPEKRISPTTLSLIYKKHKIKKKRVSVEKVMSKAQFSRQLQGLNAIFETLNDLSQQGYQILYLDEVMFTYSTSYSREYSNKNQNISITDKALKTETIAVIAAASKEEGLAHFQMFDKSVNVEKFCQFISALENLSKNKKIAIFLDNMRVHHNRNVKDTCNRLGIPLVFNLPYSPQFNPIEQVFSIVKNKYKRAKANDISNTNGFKSAELIEYSFATTDPEKIKHICSRGIERIKMALIQH